MDGSIRQVEEDSNIMHDMITEYYEGHDYDKDGLVTNDVMAYIALTKLRDYVTDLIGDEDEQ